MNPNKDKIGHSLLVVKNFNSTPNPNWWHGQDASKDKQGIQGPDLPTNGFTKKSQEYSQILLVSKRNRSLDWFCYILLLYGNINLLFQTNSMISTAVNFQDNMSKDLIWFTSTYSTKYGGPLQKRHQL